MFRELTRKKQQLEAKRCIELLKNETRGVLSVCGDDGYPYGMPMNHWYEESDGNLYFHCGKEGHRLEALQKCDKVSYCVYNNGVRSDGEWAFHVESVIVFGRMQVIDQEDQIKAITKKLCYKFTDDENYIDYELQNHTSQTLLLKLCVEHICGKSVTEA